MYTCTRAHTHTHARTGTHLHVHTRAYTHACTHTHIHACTDRHTHTHLMLELEVHGGHYAGSPKVPWRPWSVGDLADPTGVNAENTGSAPSPSASARAQAGEAEARPRGVAGCLEPRARVRPPTTTPAMGRSAALSAPRPPKIRSMVHPVPSHSERTPAVRFRNWISASSVIKTESAQGPQMRKIAPLVFTALPSFSRLLII